MFILEGKQQDLVSENNSTASGSLRDQLIENIHFERLILKIECELKYQLDYYVLILTYAVGCRDVFIYRIARWKLCSGMILQRNNKLHAFETL